MNYLDYLQSIFTWATVTNEVNYNSEETDNVIIIKEMPGSVYRDTVVKPIQLEAHVKDLATAKGLIETFAKAYNNTDFMDEFDYVKQYYGTPMVLGNFNIMGANYSSVIIISGTLIISSNISDIKQILIDGEDYETSNRTVTYTTVVDNQAVDMSGYINASQIRNGVVKVTFTMVSHGDTFTQKLRRIRRGELPINTTFTVRIIHTDNNDVEEYTLRCDSHTINSSNSALPVLSVSFIK